MCVYDGCDQHRRAFNMQGWRDVLLSFSDSPHRSLYLITTISNARVRRSLAPASRAQCVPHWLEDTRLKSVCLKTTIPRSYLALVRCTVSAGRGLWVARNRTWAASSSCVRDRRISGVHKRPAIAGNFRKGLRPKGGGKINCDQSRGDQMSRFDHGGQQY